MMLLLGTVVNKTLFALGAGLLWAELGGDKFLPWCETAELSEAGDPPSAKPSKLEMEGSEHLDVSSMGGDGGP